MADKCSRELCSNGRFFARLLFQTALFCLVKSSRTAFCNIVASVQNSNLSSSSCQIFIIKVLSRKIKQSIRI